MKRVIAVECNVMIFFKSYCHFSITHATHLAMLRDTLWSCRLKAYLNSDLGIVGYAMLIRYNRAETEHGCQTARVTSLCACTWWWSHHWATVSSSVSSLLQIFSCAKHWRVKQLTMVIQDTRRVAPISTYFWKWNEVLLFARLPQRSTHFSNIAWCDRSATCVAIASELFLNRKGDTSYKKHCSVLHPSLNARCVVTTKLRG